MRPRCRCGRFVTRLVGKQTTGFLLDGATATSVPHAPFACWSSRHRIKGVYYNAVSLWPVSWAAAAGEGKR